MILILRKDKYILYRENWLIFLGIWGEAELFLGIWGVNANTFRETRTLFAGRPGDQCIIFRDQGSKDPPPPGEGSTLSFVKAKQAFLLTHDAIKFQNPETAYKYWKAGHTLQFIKLSD